MRVARERPQECGLLPSPAGRAGIGLRVSSRCPSSPSRWFRHPCRLAGIRAPGRDGVPSQRRGSHPPGPQSAKTQRHTSFEPLGEYVMPRILISLSAAALLCLAGAASGEGLLVDRVQQENKAAMPSRGMSMAPVEARFGAPRERLDARGGQKPQWPTNNRWVHPGLRGYFQKNRILDAVAHKAAPNEVGP